MGDAKRRRNLDPDYGQSKPSVTPALVDDHCLKPYHAKLLKFLQGNSQPPGVGQIASPFLLEPRETAEILAGNSTPFLEKNNSELIGLARLGYEEKGRGLLVIPGVRFLPGLLPYIEVFYLTADEINSLPCLGRTGKGDCLRVISSYNPNSEGAACFVFADKYKITRSSGCDPAKELEKIKQVLPGLTTGMPVIFRDEYDFFLFSRGTPGNWNERTLPITHRIPSTKF